MTNTSGATIADGARFDGTYKGGNLTVLGRFEGALELRGRLQLGAQGRVKGQVKAVAVEIEGEFEGEVRADALAFGAASRATGVFLAPRLSVRDGARVEGALNVEPPKRGTAPSESAKAKGAPVKAEVAPAPAAGPGAPAAVPDDTPAPTAGAGEAAAMSA